MPIRKVIEGKRVPIKIWTHDVEEEAQKQLETVAGLPFIFHHVAAMPDVHAGWGSTVGSVIATKKAVCPSFVGVDIGCIDGETEFLSPHGWVKIKDYRGQKVCQFDPLTNKGSFCFPSKYIKLPCEEFYHIKSKYGIDLMTDANHKNLVYLYDIKYNFLRYKTMTTQEIFNEHSRLKLGLRHKFNRAFDLERNNTNIKLNHAELRVMAMVCADGSFDSRNEKSMRCQLHFKKERKIKRAKLLLKDAKIEFKLTRLEDKTTTIVFQAPMRTKTLSSFWNASMSQVMCILHEVFYWDGNMDQRCYYTRDKSSADFIQYAISALNCGSRMLLDKRKDGSIDYRVFHHAQHTKVGITSTPKTPIKKIKIKNGIKYCFTVPKGFFVIRRNGCVMTTGNCGMHSLKLNMPVEWFDTETLKKLRHSMERSIPTGFNEHKHPLLSSLDWKGWETFSQLTPKVRDLKSKAMKQMGTMGGGNHFIELCHDQNGQMWFMLHSGSRNIGKSVADVHIERAQHIMEQYMIPIPNSHLAYLAEGTQEFAAYLHDVQWAQDYALRSREEMMKLALKDIQHTFPQHKLEVEHQVNCHHNYIAIENHFGENIYVTRKGAVRARPEDWVIIPGSMGARSFIAKGRGEPESFHSSPHGAGRRMSRTKAKATYTVDDLIAQTQGVECRKDSGVVDEIPGAYKSIDEVIDNSSDLVEPQFTLKQILCIKGGEGRRRR